MSPTTLKSAILHVVHQVSVSVCVLHFAKYSRASAQTHPLKAPKCTYFTHIHAVDTTGKWRPKPISGTVGEKITSLNRQKERKARQAVRIYWRQRARGTFNCNFLTCIRDSLRHLRMVPTNTEVFYVRLMTMRGKQILVRAIEIHKENWG